MSIRFAHVINGCGLVKVCKIELLPHNRGNDVNVTHQLSELFWIKALRTVRKCLVRVMVHLYHQAICPCGNCGSSHGADLFTDPGGVARIDNHRQMSECLDHWNGRQIKCVTGIRFKSANAPLAKNNVVVSLREDVLGGHKPFLNGSGKPSL